MTWWKCKEEIAIESLKTLMAKDELHSEEIDEMANHRTDTRNVIERIINNRGKTTVMRASARTSTNNC